MTAATTPAVVDLDPRLATPVLVFDLGNVLVGAAGTRVLHDMAPAGTSEAQIIARWQHSPAVTAFESGRTTAQGFARDFVAEWGLTVTPEAFLAQFAGWVTGPYPGARELLQQLRPRHRLACLSNTNPVHWARLSTMAADFDQMFLSHRLGFMKPEPAIYATVIAELKVAPGDIHFFDDLEANVEAARAAGLNAHRVMGLDATRTRLSELGLL